MADQHSGADHPLTTPGDSTPEPAPATPDIPQPPALAPVAAADRFMTLDALRGFALLGILAMNIQHFSAPFAAYINPTVFLPFEGVNRAVYYYTHILFDMKMMSLFSMLFGAGVALYAAKAATRRDVPRVRGLWLRRMFWLFVIGMIHAYFIWEGDILVPYALTGVIALWWLRRLPPWALTLITIVLLAVASGVNMLNGWWMHTVMNAQPGDLGMNAEQLEEARRGVQDQYDMFAPSEEGLAETIAIHRGDYWTVMKERAANSFMFQTFGFLFFMFWRILAMMLLGLALFKWRVLTGERSMRFYAIFGGAGYLIGVPIILAGIDYNTRAGFQDPGLQFMYGFQYNAVGSIAVAFGHIGLVAMVVKSGLLAPFISALSAVGRMAFTNYLLQSIIATLLFYGYGLGYYGELDRLDQQFVVLAIWVLQLIVSPIWLRHFRFGPAEWLWRSLTYWRRQPLRRMASTG